MDAAGDNESGSFAPARVPTASASVCVGCGYPLAGLDPAATCPECGKPVALSRPKPERGDVPPPLPPPLPTLPEVHAWGPNAPTGIVLDNAPTLCLKCGYRLAGLRADGPCPECGLSVARSLWGDLLRDTPRGHRRVLATGVLLVTIAIIALMLGTLSVWLFGIVGSMGKGGEWVPIGLFYGFHVLFFVGWMCLTARGGGCISPGLGKLRLWTRLLLIPPWVWASMFMVMTHITIWFGGPRMGGDTFQIIWTVMFAGMFPMAAVFVAWLVVSMLYVRRWSSRVGEAGVRVSLTRRAGMLAWFVPIALIGTPLLYAGGAFLSLTVGGMGGGVVGILSMLGVLELLWLTTGWLYLTCLRMIGRGVASERYAAGEE